MRIVSIVGARPEFVQAAPLARALRRRHTEVLVHTGQHYDAAMSGRFFEQLELPQPDIDLGVGSLPASEQVAQMLQRLAKALATLDADIVIVRGDTNSTLAGALAAKHLMLPVAHVEAGMRSHDRSAPEEINRLAVDHLADLWLTTDEDASRNLALEGITRGVYVCGDVMLDAFLAARERADAAWTAGGDRAIPQTFDLLTLHRAENVDDPARLAAILAAFEDAPQPAVFPVHPRTAERLRSFGLSLPKQLLVCEPLGYLEMVAYEMRARTIFTDSGGVQREAYFAGVPCVTLRDATEWTGTIEAGWNRLTGASTAGIRRFVHDPPPRLASRPPLFGGGDAAERIAAVLDREETEQLITSWRRIRRARGST